MDPNDVSSLSPSPSQGATTGEEEKSPQLPADESNPEAEYPSRLRLALVAIGLYLAVFLFALDQNIVANAVPRITDEFKSVSEIGWYGSAFLLTTCAFQLFYGKAYSFFSIKYTFLFAVGVFELGSLVCALAPTSTALIIGRAVAGLGGSGIVAGAFIIIAHSVPLHIRPVFLSAMGGVLGIASVSGPLLGGVFTDRLTWRWCFYINLPFGAVTVIAIAAFFKPPSRPAVDNLPFLTKVKAIDWLGIVLLIPCIVCLLLALEWGGSTYPWSNGRIIALFVLFGILGIAFGFVQFRRGEKAIVPPRIIAQRSVAAAAWFAFFNGAAFLVVVYYTPLWHQVIRQASAVESGIRLLPLIVGVVIMVISCGGLVALFGYYAPFMILASVLAPIGEGLMSTWTVDATFGQWFGYEALTGLALGMGLQQPVMTVQTVLPIQDVPIASSLIVFMQTLGGAILVALGQSVFSNRLITNLESQLAGSDSGLSPEDLLQTGATDVYSKIPPQLRRPVLEAYNDAITHVYIVAICASSLTIFGSLAIEWRSVKKAKKGEAKKGEAKKGEAKKGEAKKGEAKKAEAPA
ncbi:major facilitator superfamily domain-containing protein [Cercophora newfieldiana]|uniref:Major facilitator superfamily domain-containing protein n=1 Tax=Cercophora newfieldiana TaxID=92897 RepID=A0AA40CUG4_9PEZI|nr:major facilitator superfamily domain-containing protein [Cercophora newfieldiana]